VPQGRDRVRGADAAQVSCDFLTVLLKASVEREGWIVERITQVGDDNFEAEVLRSGLPVLIDFWAPWCGPCKSIAPIIEELAREYEGRLKVAKLNVDENPGTPSRYGVRGIPNLIILKGGAVKEQLVGVVPKSRLVNAIEKVLA